MRTDEDKAIAMSRMSTVVTVKCLTDHMEKQIAGRYIGGRRGAAAWVPREQVRGDTKGQCD